MMRMIMLTCRLLFLSRIAYSEVRTTRAIGKRVRNISVSIPVPVSFE